jgi:bacillolysin
MKKNQLLLCCLLLLGTCGSLFAQTASDAVKDENDNIRYFRISGAAARSAQGNYADLKTLLHATLKANNNSDFKLVSTKETTKGKQKMLFQHYYRNVPVYDSYYNIQLIDGVPAFANGNFTNIDRVGNTIAIQMEGARSIAVSKSAYSKRMAPTSNKAELVLFRSNETQAYRYVYKVEVIYPDPTKSREIMVDAATGEVISSSSIVCSVNAPGTADTRYSGTRNITGDTFAGGLRLRQDNHGIAVRTLNNQYWADVNAIDFVDNDNNWTAAEHGFNQSAFDVHWGTERFLDYFRTTFGRNGFDNANFPVTSYVHRGAFDGQGNSVPMDNAYWDSNERTLSYGDGSRVFQPLVSLDIVAHEMGHGFAHFEVGFNRSGEASSLNEGFSDIWGAVIEGTAAPAKDHWQTGEEIMAIGFSCLRSLRAPNTEGWLSPNSNEGNYPDTRLGNFWDVNNADPHINATVLGHWFFLLSDGGSGVNDLGNRFNVTGVGLQMAAQIAYNTELVLTPGATFTDVRVASIQYAVNIWGPHSCQTIDVVNAWYAVGVGTPYSGNLRMSIVGDNSFCTTSNNYTITQLTPGSTVTWQVAINNVFTINSPNATQTTLTVTGGGTATLKAIVSAPCGYTYTLSKSISCGAPVIYSGFYTYTNYSGPPLGLVEAWGGEDNEVCYTARPTIMNTIMDIRAATSVVWQPDVMVPGLIWSQNGHNLGLTFRAATMSGTFMLTASNACGSSEKYYTFISERCLARVANPSTEAPAEETGFTLFPNPANNNIAIMANEAPGLPLATHTGKLVTEVRIYDVVGRLRKTQIYNKVTNAKVSVSDLPTGIYFVEIYSGVDKEVKNLRIVR